METERGGGVDDNEQQLRVPRRSSRRIKGGVTTVEDERGPGLDFIFVFCVVLDFLRSCRFYFVFVYFVIIVFECSLVPASFPIYRFTDLSVPMAVQTRCSPCMVRVC